MVCAKRITVWAFGPAPHWTSVNFMLIYQTVRKASRPVHIIADLHEGFYCYRDEPLSTALSRRKKIDTKYLSPARPQGIGHLSPVERTPGKGRSCCCPEVQTRPHVSCGTEFRKDDPLHFPWSTAGWWGQRKWELYRGLMESQAWGPSGRGSQQPCPLCSLSMSQQPSTLHVNEGCRPRWGEQRGDMRELWELL